MSKPRLYLTKLLPPQVMTTLTERFHLVASPGSLSPDKEALRKGLSQAQAAICTLAEQIDRDLLLAAPHLRVIANYAVGYNNLDLDAAKERGIVVTNTPDVLTEATADLAWALLLAAARRIPEGHALVQQDAWTGWEPTQLLGADVYRKTLGIVGMGRIGKAVAKRASGFCMPVLYHSRTPLAPEDTDPAWKQVPLEALLSESDYISLHVPLTPETRHLIGAAQVRLMRPTAYLINTARGPVVDEAALVEALRDGRLAGAGLDVYEQEPALHPGLRSLPQVVTLPHLGSATLSTRIRMGLVCIENVLAVLEGRPAPNRVA